MERPNFDKVFCLIPARGGSKGVHKKNLRSVGGKPLVAHSIKQAKDAGIPSSHIYVSSDSDEILEVARKHDVVAWHRPEEISGAAATTESAMMNALEGMPRARAMILLQPTSPIRFRGRIEQCMSLYDNGDYDSLLTTQKFYNFCWVERDNPTYPGLPDYAWCCTYNPRGRKRRQDLKREDYQYFDNGNLYITSRDVLESKQCRLGDKVCVIPITGLESLQIDTEEELEMVDFILRGQVNLLSVEDKDEVPPRGSPG